MSISRDGTDYLSLVEATKVIPGRPSLPTVHRWTHRGVRGVKLWSYRVGGRIYTTSEAVQEFLNELNRSDDERLARDGC